jgi:hypothetical protein
MANKSKSKKGRALRPAQTQDRRPGLESAMRPRPKAEGSTDRSRNRFQGRVALITGGDSGGLRSTRTLETMSKRRGS